LSSKYNRDPLRFRLQTTGRVIAKSELLSTIEDGDDIELKLNPFEFIIFPKHKR